MKSAMTGARGRTGRRLGVFVLLVAAIFCGCRRGGNVAWSLATPRPWFLGGDSQVFTPAVEGNAVFFCGGYSARENAEIYALDAQTGKVKWRHNVGGCVAAPVISAETVVAFGSAEHGARIEVHGLGKITGEERWKAELPGNPAPPAPVAVGDYIYFAPGSRSVLRIDARDGTVQSFDVDQNADVPSDMVWVTGTPQEAIFGYAGSAWHQRIGQEGAEPGASLSEEAGQPASLATDGRTLLLADRQGNLRAFDLENGSVLWRRHWNKILSAPTLANGQIFLSVNQGKAELAALALGSGADLWQIAEGGEAQPDWQNGRLYAASGAQVVMVDAATGKIQSRLGAPTEVTTTPLPADGLILYGTAEGVLYAVHRP